MNNPKISLIIPVYNEAAYLDQALQSVLNQTYQNFEIVVSDNASEDQSWKILQSYKERYPQFFKIHRFENQVHAFVNMKKCVELATGDLCLHFGGDDYLKTNDFLQKAIDPFTKDDQVGAHFTRLEYINAATNERICLNPPEFVEEFINLEPVDFCREFVLETSRDELFVAIFRMDTFRPIMETTYRFSIESAGWWAVLQVALCEKQKGRHFIYDREQNCILMKRVQKQPQGKVQSAAGASANRFDSPSFRMMMTLKYSFQTAKLVLDAKVRHQILWILLFHRRRKTRGYPLYLPPAIAFLLGSYFWARLYMRSRDGAMLSIVKNKILSLSRTQRSA
jgi:glycosyltransferase involved in cell wall biosynthesis